MTQTVPGLLPYLVLSPSGSKTRSQLSAHSTRAYWAFDGSATSAGFDDALAYVVGDNRSLHIMDIPVMHWTCRNRSGISCPACRNMWRQMASLSLCPRPMTASLSSNSCRGQGRYDRLPILRHPQFLVDGVGSRGMSTTISLLRYRRRWSHVVALAGADGLHLRPRRQPGNLCCRCRGRVRRVTGHPDDDETPAWSPDLDGPGFSKAIVPATGTSLPSRPIVMYRWTQRMTSAGQIN